MAIAKIFPEPEKLRRKGSASPIQNIGLISRQYIGRARIVLKYTPETAEQVLAGCRCRPLSP